MTHDELIEAVALALVNRDQERFDLPRIETVADFRCQEDASEYLANARAAIRVIAPAVLEDVAALMEGKGGVIPLAAYYARFVSGNQMPHPSGDDRNRIRHEHERRRFDRVTEDVAHAIRAMKTRYEQ